MGRSSMGLKAAIMISVGADILLTQHPAWKNQRIALVTNTVATTSQQQPVAAALLKAGFQLQKLFSPEHGFSATGADGAKMQNSIDPVTQLPVISLYGDHLAPQATDLADIDVVLFDIPDVGVRFYTYLWTLTYVLEACAAYDKPLIILDRPNPISGNLQLAEGPMLNEQYCASFIGRWNIPVRHSCTLGELALFFNTTRNIHAALTIIPCQHWDRNTFQSEGFVPTSPAIRNFNAALLYPGLGLLEATNISEGRGTDRPFEMAVAPWITNDMDAIMPDYIQTESIQVVPTAGKYAGEQCTGIRFNVGKYDHFKSVQHGLLLIKLIKDRYPRHFQWHTYPTNVNPTGKDHLNKLLGIPHSEGIFELPLKLFKDTIAKACDVSPWRKSIQPFLLY